MKTVLSDADYLEKTAIKVVWKFHGDQKGSVNKNWFHSIKKFLEKLDADEVIEAAEIAAERTADPDIYRFKYFCGICHNKIRQSHG